MRTFSSYGPIDVEQHYYVPRTALVEQTTQDLLNGHYITVWAARQRGKTWIMQQVFQRLKQQPSYDVIAISLQHLSIITNAQEAIQAITQEIINRLGLVNIKINNLLELQQLFHQTVLTKPLILILDEFDALPEKAISDFVTILRNIYVSRQYQTSNSPNERDYLLHGVALIGVRAVLGVENVSGSPFNVQRNLNIPNLTYNEVVSMFQWYEQESGQQIETQAIDRIFYEMQGQPGLTSWLGELLTETYNPDPSHPITMRQLEQVFATATDELPNNNILNIISKAKQEPYKAFVLDLFQTKEKIRFKYDNKIVNFLTMNGVIDVELVDDTTRHVKFACPFIQKRLFNYFADELFPTLSHLYAPFDDLNDTITETTLNPRNLLKRYEQYLQQNRSWLFRDAPRRATDLRIYEAVYHFNLYTYLVKFFDSYDGQVHPEFPTGNGQIDLLIRYAGQQFGLELKSFSNPREYQKALRQAAHYGHRLGLAEIWLVLFIEQVDESNRQKYEVTYTDTTTGVQVYPVFVIIIE